MIKLDLKFFWIFFFIQTQAGALGFTATRLSMVGTRADVTTKTMANDQLNRIFFNRQLLFASLESPVVAQNINPSLQERRIREKTLSGIHRSTLELQHLQQTKFIQVMAFCGFSMLGVFGAFFWPAVVSLFQVCYFTVRITTEMIAQTNPVRNSILQFPHLSSDAESSPLRHLGGRFLSLKLNNNEPSDAFIQQYPVYQYKYGVNLKRQYNIMPLIQAVLSDQDGARFDAEDQTILEEMSDDDFVKHLEK